MIAIPRKIQDFTPQWFTEILDKQVDEAKFISKHEGTTARVKFSLKGDKSLPASIFLKVPPSDEAQRQFVNAAGMGATEVAFYQQLAKEVPVRVAKPYFSAFDGDYFVMVLEDLDITGCRYPTAEDTDVIERVQNIIQELAGMHALYWQSKRFQPDGNLGWLQSHGTGSPDGGVSFVKMAADKIGSHMPKSFQQMTAFYLKHGPQIIKLLQIEPKTLAHGDIHFGNLFVDVKNNNRTGFLDWAQVSYAPGMRDIALLLSASVPTDIRIKYEKKWIEDYCRLLQDKKINFSFEKAWEHYRLFSIYSWVAATATAAMGAKWQPIELSLATAKRTTTVCEQIDSFGLVKSMLEVAK